MATTQQIDPMAQLLLTFLGGSSDQSQSGSKTGQTSSNTSNTGTQTTAVSADTAALKDVFSRLIAGPTQQDIATIFETGAKEVPGLQTSFAQSAGLQTGSNSALQTSLADLQSRITGKVLEQKTQMLGQAAGVAQALGSLSQTQTTTTDNTSKTDGTSSETSKGSGSQDAGMNSDKLRQLLLGGTLLGGLVGEGSGGYGPGIGELFKSLSGGKSLMDLISGGGMTIDPNGMGINVPDILKQFNNYTDNGGVPLDQMFDPNVWEQFLGGL